MRRAILVLSAVLAAVTLSAFSAVLAQAQAVDQYAKADGGLQEEGAAPDKSAPTKGEAPPPPEDTDEPTAAGVDERVVNSVAKDPYSRIVDNATRGRFSAPGWEKVKDPTAYGGSFVRSREGRKSDARFEMKVPETGYYTVYARWSQAGSNASDASLSVSTADGVRRDSIDQSASAADWVTIGFFKLKEGAKRSVSISPGPDGSAVADAVMISKNVLVGANAQMVSVGDPDMYSGDTSRSEQSTSSRTTIKKRRAIVSAARNHLGKGYDYDHAPCRRGMAREDCSCFTRNVFLNFGKSLRDSPVYQWQRGKRISRANTHQGDLVFQDMNKDGDLRDHYADHVTIWSGNGYVIHASSYFGKVVESQERYLDNYWGTKRVSVN